MRPQLSKLGFHFESPIYIFQFICFKIHVILWILNIVAVFVFVTPPKIFFSWNTGQLRPAVTLPCRLPTPLCHTYSEPSGHELLPGGTQNIPYQFKNLSKSRFCDPFFGLFLVISEVGSQIYIANLAIFKIWVFSATFWHEITLYAIDIDKKGSEHIFQHSRTTENGPPPDSSFWKICSCLLSDWQGST